MVSKEELEKGLKEGKYSYEYIRGKKELIVRGRKDYGSKEISTSSAFLIISIIILLLGLGLLITGNVYGIYAALLGILMIIGYFIKKKGGKYKVGTGVKSVGKGISGAFGKIPFGGGGWTWLVLKGIGIGLFIGLIGYFGYFAYNGYRLGTLGGLGLILTIIGGLVILFLFLKFLSAKGKSPGDILKLILIIILVIAAIYGLWQINKLGMFQKGAVSFEKIQLLDRVKLTFNSLKEKLTNYVYGFGAWTAPETVAKAKPVGIEIQSFTPRRTIFRANKDEVSVIALVKAYGLSDRDVSISFDCDLEGKEPNQVIVSGSLGKQITVPRKQEFSMHQVMCTFDPVEEVPGEGEFIVKKVNLIAKYENFSTISKLKVYTMDATELKNIELTGKNPFKVYKVEDPLVTEERNTIPVQDANTPVELWLNLPLMQPLTAVEKGYYTLGFKLKHNKVRWGGAIDKVKEIHFEFPENLKTSTRIENLDKMSEQLQKGELSTDTGYIDFIVREATPGLNYDIIKAMVIYDYTFKDSTAIEIAREKDF